MPKLPDRSNHYKSLAIKNKEITRHQLEIATEMLTLGGEELLKLATKVRENPDVLILEPDFILRLIKEGSTLQRLILGEPTEIAEIKDRRVNYEQLTMEQLIVMKDVKKKLGSQLN